VRFWGLGLACLALAGAGASVVPAADASNATTVGAPTPAQRAAVAADVESVWKYESRSIAPGVPALTERPHVVSVRVSRTDPVFASAAVELLGPAGQHEPGTEVVVFEQIRGSWQQYGQANEVAGPATSFAAVCTEATPVGVRDLLCPDPWAVLDYPQPASPSVASYAIPVGTNDLHKVAWDDIALPGAVCGANHPIQLHKGYATVLGPAEGWWSGVVAELSGESYGELAPGLDVASVAVGCNNGGGTADGQLAFLDLVVSASNDSLHILADLTAQQPLIVPASHVPIIGVGRISRGEIVVPEYWYGPYDPTCCSTGRAKTIWVYSGGKLRVKQTIVLHQAATKPPSS